MPAEHPDDPQFAALHARCKAAGVDLMRAMDFEGEQIFVVSRWGLFKELPTLLAVGNWLDWTEGKGRPDA